MIGFANRIVDRAIFCLNNNENYIGFWNYISKVYSEKFDTKATLMFSGTEEELGGLMKSGRLSTNHGDIVLLPRVAGVAFSPNLDWTCTWGLFYGASLFPNDVCMLSGIDQIPLSGRFYELINNIDARQKYVVGFSDAYNHAGAWSFPSSHHVGLGRFFKQIYSIQDRWEEELIKVFNHEEVMKIVLRDAPKGLEGTLWGMDEVYSSYILQEHLKNNTSPVPILLVKDFFAKHWACGRIDRFNGAIPITNDIISGIRASRFTEYHSVRPFSSNPDMNLIYDAIPNVANIYSF